jgi:CheY-like chemotaxis protein
MGCLGAEVSAPFRLLVADDDPVLREILCEGLEQEGFEVVAAEDGIQALQLFRTRGPFSALLVDEEMPRLTGRQVLEQTRDERDRVATLIISGNLTLNASERTTLNVHDVLRKPISLEELTAAVRGAIASKDCA